MTLERPEAGASDADRATAGPNSNRACWKDADGREHLFEWLIGSLPFTAWDPIGWVHCQGSC